MEWVVKQRRVSYGVKWEVEKVISHHKLPYYPFSHRLPLAPIQATSVDLGCVINYISSSNVSLEGTYVPLAKK